MITRRFAYPLSAVLLGFAPALAQDNSLMQAIYADQAMQQHVIEAAKHAPVVVNNPCPSAHFTVTGKAIVFVLPERDSAGSIRKGAWKEEVRQEGCGQDRILNVLGVVQGPGTLGTVPLLPGNTRGDPQLQKDAVQYAMIAAGASGKDCAQGYVENTEFTDQGDKPVAGGKGPPWRELWTVIACGRKAQVTMRFIPDATGTTIGAERRIAPAEPSK